MHACCLLILDYTAHVTAKTHSAFCFVYFASHINRKTQFENPVQAQHRQSMSSYSSAQYSSPPPPHQGPPSFQSAAALAKAQEAEAHSRFVFILNYFSQLSASERVQLQMTHEKVAFDKSITDSPDRYSTFKECLSAGKLFYNGQSSSQLSHHIALVVDSKAFSLMV